MKKNRVNEILIKQTKRRNMVLSLCAIIVLLVISALSCFMIYANRTQDYYVTYSEKSDIDYKVHLKNNDFFEDNYLGTDKRYIANLIDYITADFEYKLSLDEEEDIDYKYVYRIDALVDVKLKDTEQSMYSKTINLVKETEKSTSETDVIIKDSVDVDYNYFNDLIKKFVSMYDLDDIESTLYVNMYINIIGSCEDFEENAEKESVVSLSMPLTTKTIAIDLSDNLVDTENNVMQCKKIYDNTFVFMFFGVVFVVGAVTLTVYTIRYELKTRTAENIYERELKKILNNYGSYIQNLGNDFDFSEYQILKLDTFADMLEIRDTIRNPILMKENSEKTGAYFVIPSNTKILYVYRLMVSDIEKNKQD